MSKRDTTLYLSKQLRLFQHAIQKPNKGIIKVADYYCFSQVQVSNYLFSSHIQLKVLPHGSLLWLPSFPLVGQIWLLDLKFLMSKVLGRFFK